MSEINFREELILIANLHQFNVELNDYIHLHHDQSQTEFPRQILGMIYTIKHHIQLMYTKTASISSQAIYLSIYSELKELEARLEQLTINMKAKINRTT